MPRTVRRDGQAGHRHPGCDTVAPLLPAIEIAARQPCLMRVSSRQILLHFHLACGAAVSVHVTVFDGHKKETALVNNAVLMETESPRRASMAALRGKYREVFSGGNAVRAQVASVPPDCLASAGIGRR